MKDNWEIQFSWFILLSFSWAEKLNERNRGGFFPWEKYLLAFKGHHQWICNGPRCPPDDCSPTKATAQWCWTLQAAELWSRNELHLDSSVSVVLLGCNCIFGHYFQSTYSMLCWLTFPFHSKAQFCPHQLKWAYCLDKFRIKSCIPLCDREDTGGHGMACLLKPSPPVWECQHACCASTGFVSFS